MNVLTVQAGAVTSVPNVPDIAQTLSVGVSGDVDYTSIKSAVDAAVSGGASSSTWWRIDVAPGTYVEDPMTLPAGVIVSFIQGARSLGCFVNANNAVQDLFTMTGGVIVGLTLAGVTDVTKALVRCTSGLSVVWNISVRNCTTGLIVGTGAIALAGNFVCSITGAGQRVSLAAAKVESGGFLGVNGGLGSAPSAVLPAYADNPIERLFVCDGGRLTLVSYYCDISPKNSAQAAVEINNGGEVTALSSEWRNNQRAFFINAGGSNSKATVQGVMGDNITNFQSDSATGKFFVNVSVDDDAQSLVTGALLTGIVQIREGAQGGDTHLQGQVHVIFNSGREADMETSLFDGSVSGVSSGGGVSTATGLDVNVAAGAGWIYRDANSDTTAVSWTGTTKTLSANATNYVYYDAATLAIANGTSAPSNGSILLAQVITSGSGIRYIHNMRRTVLHPVVALNEYLLSVQEFALQSGLGVTEGGTARTLNIASGAYYRAMYPITYAGATPATFSYFYGTNAATEVASQTQVSNTQYDNAGTLTALTASYYRTDTVILTSDGRVNVIYGTAEFATLGAAQSAAPATVPTFMDATGVYLAQVVCQEGEANIVEVIDLRPIRGVSASGGSTGNHSLLSNLSADDHTQYLLVSGSRAMGGDLDLGANDITNVGLVDGVDVPAHGSRHNPGGADAIATATPTATLVGAAAVEGSAASLARSDHQHGVAAGVAPANVTKATAAEGISSSAARADHKHDISTASATSVGAANGEGAATSLARSDHTHRVTQALMPEIAEPATPAADTAHLYCIDQNNITSLQYKDGTGLVVQLARDNIVRVLNTSGGPFAVGQVVSGPAVGAVLAQANSTTTLALGVVVEAIANGTVGRLLVAGRLGGLNTVAFAAGAPLYLSAVTPGALTDTMPAHPNLQQQIGEVAVSHASAGIIDVDIRAAFGAESGTNQNSWKVGNAAAGNKDLILTNGFEQTLRANPSANRLITLPDFDGADAVYDSDGTLRFAVQSSIPAALASTLRVYSRSRAGRALLQQIGPAGLETSLQPALFGNAIANYAPASGTTPGQVFGWVFTSTGTVSHPALSASAPQPRNSMRRTRWASATTANAIGGIFNSISVCWRGNAAGLGGFFFAARFAMNTNIAASRAFVGLSALTSGIVGGEPTAANNTIGVGFDSTDPDTGNWFLIRRDGTTTAKVDLGANAARNTTDVFDLFMFAPPNGSDITVRVVNMTTDTVVLNNVAYSTEIPTAASFLRAHAMCGPAAAAVATNFELARMYLETDT